MHRHLCRVLSHLHKSNRVLECCHLHWQKCTLSATTTRSIARARPYGIATYGSNKPLLPEKVDALLNRKSLGLLNPYSNLQHWSIVLCGNEHLTLVHRNISWPLTRMVQLEISAGMTFSICCAFSRLSPSSWICPYSGFNLWFLIWYFGVLEYCLGFIASLKPLGFFRVF